MERIIFTWAGAKVAPVLNVFLNPIILYNLKQLFNHSYFYLPFLSLLAAFIVFFSSAIKYKGIQRLRTFTAVVAITLATIIFIVFFFHELFLFLPFQVIAAAHNGRIAAGILFGSLIYFVAAFIFVRKEKSTEFLFSMWLILGLFNLADLIWNGYNLFTWQLPLDYNTMHPEQRLMWNIRHSSQREYMMRMIYPFFWVLVSGIGILKIYKEKRRSNAATMKPV